MEMEGTEGPQLRVLLLECKGAMESRDTKEQDQLDLVTVCRFTRY